MEMQISWSGPFAWPGYETQNGLPHLPSHSGVYLWTFEYGDGYLIYVAGLTRRLFRERFDEHTLCYMSGDYTVLDATHLRNAVRTEVWPGWGWARTHREQFVQRQTEICEAARRQLTECRVFATDVELPGRVPERLEAAIMNCLYAEAPPLCDVPDRGMALSPRWSTEDPILVRNACASKLHGLPERLSI